MHISIHWKEKKTRQTYQKHWNLGSYFIFLQSPSCHLQDLKTLTSYRHLKQDINAHIICIYIYPNLRFFYKICNICIHIYHFNSYQPTSSTNTLTNLLPKLPPSSRTPPYSDGNAPGTRSAFLRPSASEATWPPRRRGASWSEKFATGEGKCPADLMFPIPSNSHFVNFVGVKSKNVPKTGN